MTTKLEFSKNQTKIILLTTIRIFIASPIKNDIANRVKMHHEFQTATAECVVLWLDAPRLCARENALVAWIKLICWSLYVSFIISDYLHGENCGFFVKWLQNCLLEACYAKIVLGERNQPNKSSVEPIAYFYTCKFPVLYDYSVCFYQLHNYFIFTFYLYNFIFYITFIYIFFYILFK